MTQVFIVGGAGKIARRLAPLLAGRGHGVSSLHRRPEQEAELAALGAAPVAGDLAELSAPDLAAMMAGHDIALFSAGAGGKGMELTNAVDGKGLETSVEAAKRAGIGRFILVSAFMDAGRGGERREGFENYMRVKRLADAHLAASGLDYVILRPGTLTDDPGTGRVSADLAIPYGNVPRDDVAAYLAEIVERPNPGRLIIELTEGETPVAEAGRSLWP